eukprot:13311223-Alexandrium_andersonii.AAC.1
MARAAGGASLGRAPTLRRIMRQAASNRPGMARLLKPSTPSWGMEASGATRMAGPPSRAQESSSTMAVAPIRHSTTPASRSSCETASSGASYGKSKSTTRPSARRASSTETNGWPGRTASSWKRSGSPLSRGT